MKKVFLMTFLSLLFMNFETFDRGKLTENTVCATGIIESAEFGSIEMTVCYTGPETGSELAAKHRELIKRVREQADN